MIAFSLENLLYFYLPFPGSARCFGLFTSFIQVHTGTIVSSKIVDKFYMQLVSFSQLKGFLDVGRPPFFKFHEKMNIFYFHLPLCLNTYISSFMYEILFSLFISFVAMWFVHPGIQFASS